jgi:hypothetical protein
VDRLVEEKKKERKGKKGKKEKKREVDRWWREGPRR